MITNANCLIRLLLLAGALLLALAGCGPPPGPATTPTPEGAIIKPGERLRITAEPVAGPTEENPQVELDLVIIDQATGTAVPATVSLDGKIVAKDVAEFKVRLPGHLADRPVTVTVEALGYGKWETEARWNVNHSRTLRLPVQLKKLKPQA